MKSIQRHRAASLIFAAYVLLAGLYSVVIPPFEASDELWHYPMVQHLAANGFALPVQSGAAHGAWRQEGSQPPLYYLLAAALTAGIDTSDLDFVRRINPHADIGLVRPDGNANMIVHRDEAEAFPWRGAILALHVSRFFSILLGAGTVVATYVLSRLLFPQQPLIALLAMTMNAFLPMFLFIAGSVNNDNLSNLLGSLLTLIVTRLLIDSRPPSLRMSILTGATMGAGLLAKLNLGFFIPVIALVYALASWRARSLRPLIVGGLVSGGLTIFISGWWYLRNAQLYGDPTGLNIFLDIVGRRPTEATFAQLWAERFSFTQAFWGFFGGVNVPLPQPVYTVFDLIAAVGIVGAALLIFTRLIRPRPSERLNAAHLVTGLWIAITFISYVRWTAETPASQGRLVFGALSAILMWLSAGLLWLLPARARKLGAWGVGLWFAAVALYAPLAVITPAYAKPDPIPPVESPEFAGQFLAPDRGALALRSDGLRLPETVRVGDYARIEMRWQVEQPLARDWSLFVHLLTPDGVIIAQRDIYPGGGTLATSDLPAGFAWENPVAIFVPETAYAPTRVEVVTGWYHLPTGERLHLNNGADTISLGTFQLEPRPSDNSLPNPQQINFGGLIELAGYAISDLSPAAGDEIALTLYWRALTPIARDYTVFAHIVDPPTQTLYAGSDAQPAAWTRPTSSWQVGEIIEDRHTLRVDPNTPPGIYEVEIGLYLQEEGFKRLRVIAADGTTERDYAYLSRVRVMPREDVP